MIIGFYTDLHASKSMSILKGTTSCKYSSRLDMVVDSMKWMYDTFKENNVELIINAGDTFDSDILLPEENSAMAEAFSYSYGIPEYHILGNHEIRNKDKSYNSVAMLSNYPFIEIVKEPKCLNLNDGTKVALLPYNSDYENYDFLQSLGRANYLVSHADYIGLQYDNGRASIHGYAPQLMLDNYGMIFNGHIHSASSNFGNKLINIGSLLGTGFGNSYSGGFPGIILLDTSTNTYKRIPNPHSPIFLKKKFDSISSLIQWLPRLNTGSKYCLKLEVPYLLKDDARNLIDNYKENNKGVIVADRLQSIVDNSSILVQSKEDIVNLNNYENGVEALREYIKTATDLPSSLEDMEEFIKNHLI